jgi:hypothetical protein
MVAYRLWRREGLNSIKSSSPRHTALLPSRRFCALKTPPVRSSTSMPTNEFTFPVLPPALKYISSVLSAFDAAFYTSRVLGT